MSRAVPPDLWGDLFVKYSDWSGGYWIRPICSTHSWARSRVSCAERLEVSSAVCSSFAGVLSQRRSDISHADLQGSGQLLPCKSACGFARGFSSSGNHNRRKNADARALMRHVFGISKQFNLQGSSNSRSHGRIPTAHVRDCWVMPAPGG